MHLNDEQLLEPSPCDLRHLQQCDYCQQKRDTISKIRRGLAERAPVPNFAPQWEDILAAQKEKTEKESEQAVAFIAQHPPRRLSTWLAFAASLLFVAVLYFQHSEQVKQSDIEAQIAELVAENQQLQMELAKLQVNMKLQDHNRLTSYQRILSLDKVIQQSYLDQLSPQTKHQLWQERRQLLHQLVLAPTNRKGIKI